MKKIIESKEELFNLCFESIKRDIVNQQSMILRTSKNKQEKRMVELKKELNNLNELKKYFKKCYPIAEFYWEEKINKFGFKRKFTSMIEDEWDNKEDKNNQKVE